jgi:ribosomal protein S18 acetylase RimI-like enzyme
VVSRRRATDADRDRLRTLHRRAIRSAGSDPADVPGDYLDSIAGSFDGRGGVLYVLEDGDDVVAMGGLRPVAEGGDTAAELVRIAVAPEHQGEGLGDRIVGALESFARETGFERVGLETTARQRAARGLYRSRGYEETGRRRVGEYEVLAFEKRL